MANNLVDTAKLNTQAAELSKELKEAYFQLGKQYYEMHGEEPEERLKPLCVQVKGILTMSEKVRQELNLIRNVLVCPSCGHENIADAKFCAQCSAQLPQMPKRVEQSGIVFCPNCGNKLSQGKHFCPKCGTKLD